MKELFNLFDEIGLPYFQQGSLSIDDYPPTFFTVFNYDTPYDSFYDNGEHRYIELVQVCLYTTDAESVYTIMDDFIRRAKGKGFVVSGMAHDVMTDKDNYYGRLCNIKIIHRLEDKEHGIQ